VPPRGSMRLRLLPIRSLGSRSSALARARSLALAPGSARAKSLPAHCLIGSERAKWRESLRIARGHKGAAVFLAPPQSPVAPHFSGFGARWITRTRKPQHWTIKQIKGNPLPSTIPLYFLIRLISTTAERKFATHPKNRPDVKLSRSREFGKPHSCSGASSRARGRGRKRPRHVRSIAARLLGLPGKAGQAGRQAAAAKRPYPRPAC